MTWEIHSLDLSLCKEASLLEKCCLSTAWSEKQLEDIVNHENYRYVVAIGEGKVLGVGGAICSSPDSAEIFTVAVDPRWRGNGIGSGIVSKLIEFCHYKNAECIFLEVEEGNHSAISLYSKHGFVNVGVRKGFYHGKNANIMCLSLK